ncbi:MAG: L-lactate permease [Oscillospiraceae bacterium]|nr:L-lactate permease [Oscillospiraceae bacterium]
MKKTLNKNYLGFMLTTAAVFLVGLILTLCGVTAAKNGGGFINVITFLLAFMPILIVLIGMLGFDLSALKVAPFAFLLAVLLTITYFADVTLTAGQAASAIWAQTWAGIVSALYIVGLIFFSFLILEMMKVSGAMDIVKNKIATISGDRRVQLILVGLFVPIFMEGAAGAGTPAAIAAPFMVGLGFDPILAVVIALMSDGVCTSFGGAGLTTMSGSAQLVADGITTTVDTNFAAAGMFHMVGILVMPFLILAMAYGKKGFKGKGIVGYALYCGVVGALLMLLFSNYVGGFITDMGTGLGGIILAVLGLKIFKIETPEELFYKVPESKEKPKFGFVRALSPYLFILVIFPVVLTGSKYITVGSGETAMPLWNFVVSKVTYNGWIDILLFIVSLLSILSLSYGFNQYCKSFWASLKKVIGVLVIMASLLAVANIMKIVYTTDAEGRSISMITRLAYDLANIAGPLYPAVAVLIGGIGSFITGTNLGANQLFAKMHIAAAQELNCNAIMTFAAGNGGGSLGNMICPNNVTAACATVGMTGRENEVMKRVALMFLVTCVLYMILGMLYTFVIFPNVGPDTLHMLACIG